MFHPVVKAEINPEYWVDKKLNQSRVLADYRSFVI
jgi:hypothetical protein